MRIPLFEDFINEYKTINLTDYPTEEVEKKINILEIGEKVFLVKKDGMKISNCTFEGLIKDNKSIQIQQKGVRGTWIIPIENILKIDTKEFSL